MCKQQLHEVYVYMYGCPSNVLHVYVILHTTVYACINVCTYMYIYIHMYMYMYTCTLCAFSTVCTLHVWGSLANVPMFFVPLSTCTCMCTCMCLFVHVYCMMQICFGFEHTQPFTWTFICGALLSLHLDDETPHLPPPPAPPTIPTVKEPVSSATSFHASSLINVALKCMYMYMCKWSYIVCI